MARPAYQFYSCFRPCPACHGRLVSHTPLTRRFTQGLLHRLGVTCYCVRCNVRYRATSWLRYSAVAWLGPLGRWLWWQTTALEQTLKESLPTEL